MLTVCLLLQGEHTCRELKSAGRTSSNLFLTATYPFALDKSTLAMVHQVTCNDAITSDPRMEDDYCSDDADDEDSSSGAAGAAAGTGHSLRKRPAPGGGDKAAKRLK